MRPRLDICLILGGLFMMLTSGGAAFADNVTRLAEMQKSLNDEVLAQPFSVAEPAKRPVAVEPTLQSNSRPRYSKRYDRLWVYPHLSFGWHYGHHSHGFGWRYGHRPHRHKFYKGHHFYRYRRH